MFIKFSEEAQKILKKSKLEMQKLKHSFVGSEHLLLSILGSKNNVSKKLLEYGVTYDNFKSELVKSVGEGNTVNDYFIYTPLLKRVLEDAIIETREINSKEVSLETIFLSILDEGEGVAVRILGNMGVNIDEMYEEMNNREILKKAPKKLLINEIGVDLVKKAKEGNTDPLIGRDREVEEIIEILLRKNKNNPLLIGEAGVGKTAIVEELAKRIYLGNIPDKLKNNRVFSLSMASCVAGTKYRGEFEERITKMLKELENNQDIILFIDEIHTIVGAGGAEGAIDASNILKPALARGKIRLIGATTVKEYKETILKDKALNRRFQNVLVKENTIDETKTILYKLKGVYEDYHNVTIPEEVLDKLIILTDKYIQDKKNPDKSLDILDTVCAKVSLSKNKKAIKLNELKEELENLKKTKNELIINHQYTEASKIRLEEIELESKINKLNLVNKCDKKIITINDISDVIETKTGIPLYEIKQDNKKVLKLKKHLNNKVIGQEKVIDEIVKYTKKMMLGLKSELPSSFLLVGSSGVGKTLLVKEYAKFLNIPLIRLDMSEYKESHTISKIIGSPPGYIGYNDTDTVIEKIRNHPYSILLLDEIEKSCSEVINLFLQILDEGVITDSHGNTVSLKNTIIMMTSNIGSNKDTIGFNNNENKDRELINILSTPFVNRINKVLYFDILSEESIRKIIKIRLKEIKEKYRDNNISLSINEKIIDKIIKSSKYEMYGARKLGKIIDEMVDDVIIDNLLIGKKNIAIKN